MIVFPISKRTVVVLGWMTHAQWERVGCHLAWRELSVFRDSTAQIAFKWQPVKQTEMTMHTSSSTEAERHNNSALKNAALKTAGKNVQVKRGDFISQRLWAFHGSWGAFCSHQNQSLLPNAQRFEHTFWLKSATCQVFMYLFIYFIGGRVGAVSSGDVHSLSLLMLQNVCFHPVLKRVKAAWCYLLSAHPNTTLAQSLCPTSHDRSQAINLCMFWQLHRLKESLQ